MRSYLEEIVAAAVKKTESNDRGDPLRWPRNNLYPQKLVLLRQQATEFFKRRGNTRMEKIAYWAAS
jgi:hypothetical protein